MRHRTTAELDACLDHASASPSDRGTVELVVCRPTHGERRVLPSAELVVGAGLVGDNYLARRTPHPEAQLNVMSSRMIDAVTGGDREHWPLAGDQLFLDLDLSADNLPVGTRLAVGDAVIEVTAKPHTGCAKFRDRFGVAAARWVNAVADERRRGVCAAVVTAGTVRPGDPVVKLA